MDVTRGGDSTGLAAIHMKKDEDKHFIFKEVGQPYNLYETYKKDFTDDGLYLGHLVDCFIGHNRYATQGGVSKETAHPFEFDNLIGAHNGTVHQYSIRDFHNAKSYKVDSQIIFSQLSFDNDLQHVWDNADGAMALTWWDKRTRDLHIARNEERTLFYTYTDDLSTVFWASEVWMLNIVLGKIGIKHKEIKPIEPNKHYVFNCNELQVKEEVWPLIPFEKKPMTNHGYGIWGGFGGKTKTFRIKEFANTGTRPWDGHFIGIDEDDEEIFVTVPFYNAEQTFTEVTSAIAEGKPYFNYRDNLTFMQGNMRGVAYINIKHMPNIKVFNKKQPLALPPPAPRQVKDYFGNPISRKQWKHAHINCVCCEAQVSWRNADTGLFLTPDNYVCGDCREIDYVKNWIQEDLLYNNV